MKILKKKTNKQGTSVSEIDHLGEKYNAQRHQIEKLQEELAGYKEILTSRILSDGEHSGKSTFLKGRRYCLVVTDRAGSASVNWHKVQSVLSPKLYVQCLVNVPDENKLIGLVKRKLISRELFNSFVVYGKGAKVLSIKEQS